MFTIPTNSFFTMLFLRAFFVLNHEFYPFNLEEVFGGQCSYLLEVLSLNHQSFINLLTRKTTDYFGSFVDYSF